jgi:hypothetical protein
LRHAKARALSWSVRFILSFTLIIVAQPGRAFGASAGGNATQPAGQFGSATFDFGTAAVVSFVLVLLGLAAGLVLLQRFARETPSIGRLIET